MWSGDWSIWGAAGIGTSFSLAVIVSKETVLCSSFSFEQ